MNERMNTVRKYNLHLYNEFETVGRYQMPIIYKEKYIPHDLIGFNYMLSSKNKNVGVHMFVDDYQIERLWNTPEKYIENLRQFDCIFTPDYSLYMDMPLSMKIWNTYRSRLLGQYWQKQGIMVIPTISWAEPETFDFCFDGIEKGSVVAISTIGVKRDPFAVETWKEGVAAMIKNINPSTVLIYGEKIDFDFKSIPVFMYANETIKRLRKIEVKK